MTIEHFLAFNLALLAAIASPGPALLVAIQSSVHSGRRAGMATGAGLGLIAAGWTLMALFGLEAVFRLVPPAYIALKVAGALYLLYLAWKMWTGAPVAPDAPSSLAGRAFRRGILVNLLNPKSVLFAAAVLVVVFPAGFSALDKAVIVTNHLAVELLFYSALACGLGSPAVSRRYLGLRKWIDRTAAVILGALGLRLLVGR